MACSPCGARPKGEGASERMLKAHSKDIGKSIKQASTRCI
jgi:hypothetical protein